MIIFIITNIIHWRQLKERGGGAITVHWIKFKRKMPPFDIRYKLNCFYYIRIFIRLPILLNKLKINKEDKLRLMFYALLKK